MYISSFHIDGFGILSNVTVEDLYPGINIFLGRNESGKSTCLEFLRVMLTGYPGGREKNEKYRPVSSNAKPGGTLYINCENPDGTLEKIKLTRRPSNAGGLSLLGENDNLLTEERLAAIFAGISQEVYRKVFGFSLGELESFETLSEDGVRNALYGASFGPGLLSPAVALKELKNRKEALFKGSASKPPINAALKELDEKRKLIRSREDEIAAYDQLCLARDRHREELGKLQMDRKELEARLRLLQRRLSVWEQWDQWRKSKDKLARMPLLPSNFPEEALQRLAQIRALRDERETDLAAQRKKLDSLRERRDLLVPDRKLIEMLPALRSLAERKSVYRQANNDLDSHRESLVHAREELADILARLGPDWNCERIRGTNRSLFAREDLARHEEELHNAQLACQAAGDTLESANQEVEACEKAYASASETLDNFPEPDAILTLAERDDLRQTMGRLNESRRLEQTREKAFKSAQEAFERSLAQAKISIHADEMDMLAEAAKVLKTIDSSQEEARQLSAELQTRQSELEAINQKSARLEENAENVRLKAEATIAMSRGNPASSRDSLEMKSRALRALRSLSSQIDSAKERLQDLDARISSSPQPVRAINWTLLVIGIIFILGGGVLFLANYFWGLAEISISGGPSLEINLWMCYLAIACGIILLTFGFPPNNAEKRRYEREMAQLQASRENAAQRMAELDGQARQLFETASVDSMDPITLDAVEMLLDREKEQCIHDERSQREAENLQRELSAIRQQLASLQREAHLKERDIQQCRRKWLALMDSLHIADCPSPESVATVFARMEAASIALGNLQAANQELESLWEDLHLLEASITSMPAIQEKLQSAPLPLSLEEAVNQTLEACREADIAQEQRNVALSSVKTVKSALESARRRQEAAALRLEKASQKLASSRAAWNEAIAEFGLGGNMDPQIMREALQLMEQALLAEEKLLHIEQETLREEKEKAAFEAALSGFLDRLGRERSEGRDCLHELEALLEDAARADEILNERKRLDSLVMEHEDEYGAREAALATGISQLQALLKQGGAENEDSFTQTARLVEEKRQLEENLNNLESSLRIAAGAQSLEDFLADFQLESRESQEKKLSALEMELSALGDTEREKATALGGMEQRLENMATTDSLSRLRQEEAMLVASLDKMTREWTKLALAEAILLKAKYKFEKERQPEVIRIASEIFSKLTRKHWRGLKTSLEDARLEILQEHGEPIPPYLLSRGAQEQAYLALRLAYIQDHARHAIPLPLIMDEILVNFDPERAEQAAKTFADLIQNPPPNKLQQLLYFTCHPGMVEILRSAAPSSRLYVVEDGKITPA